jgi:glycosyltransferase involved in cell wall biosynthesis
LTCQNIEKRYPFPFNVFESYSLARARGWIGCGEAVVGALSNRAGWRDRPRRSIPFGVDLETFRPNAPASQAVRRELGWPGEGPPVVGYLGRFVPEKGIPLLLRTLERVKTPWRALFVGGGPLEGTIRAWCDRHPGSARVVTNVTHARAPDFLNAMDLLCMPSQTTPRWKEQFGRVLVEALACGVPVLGSDSGEVPHVLGDCGLVVGECDEEAWVEQLGGLLAQPANERRARGLRGLERAARLFSWPVVARQHLEFLGELLDAGP